MAKIEGARSISVWWTIVTAVLGACMAVGFTWGGNASRMDRQDHDIAEVKSDLTAVQTSAADLKTYRDDTGKRLDKLSLKIDKQADSIVQLVRVVTRVATKVGVDDE